ncbi:MAG: TraM recognition domain-containing protein [Parcubacteria group bacterium]
MEKIAPETLPRFTSPEAELSFLREKVASKERELLLQKEKPNLGRVVEEEISRYRDVLSKDVLDETYALAKHDKESIILNLEPEKHDKKMEELVGIVHEKGIKNAMSVLSGLNDPHLEDDFHRFLAQYVKQGYSKKEVDVSSREFRGANMTLYEVVLPEDISNSGQEKTKSLKEIVSNMEQFLAGMLSVITKDETKTYKENYIVLEIANANGSDQFVFYVAVPNNHKDLFEKQIISIFHNARLTEVTSDYNIFNTDGVSVGSYLESSNNTVFQFKTYEAFDHDPMNVILNSFSKIQKEGEGAGIQIVFSPQGDYFNKKYEYAIEKIENGTPTKDAINLPESITQSFKKEVFSFFKSPAKPDEEKKPIDTEAIQKIKQKTSTTIVATNIRLIASAKSRVEAETILKSLESSFNQFTDSASTGLKAKRLEKSALQKMFRDYSFRSYDASELLPLNLRELTTIFHFHTTALSPTPQLKQTQSISAPAPADIGNSGTLLGVNTYRNIETPIYMQDEDRLRHLYTIGQTGTGKTTLLKNMIIQDITKGNGACFIDPHGSDVLDILSNIPQDRFQDVIYFDPSYTERPMALNMLEYDRNHPEQKTFVVNELFSIFQKLYGKVPESLGPMFEQYFRNATMLVIEDPDTGCTLLDVSRVMTNKEFRQMKLSHCKNPIVVQFWTEVAEKAGGEASLANIVPYITSKFDVFLANDIMRPIIAQEKSSFDFRKIMDDKKILLVNLSKGRLGDINANLIGLILVGKILMAALSRVDSLGQNLPPFYLYIDEFQNITTNSISTILSEARKYKLSLNVAHQFIAQLQEDIRDAVFGNVGSIATFRVGAEDAEYLEKQFSPVFTAKDIMNIDNHNAYLKMLVGGRPVKAFNIRASAPPKGNPEIVDKLKQLSYITYGGDRDLIESDILKKYQK